MHRPMDVLVGKMAPQFVGKAVVKGGIIEENFSLKQFIGKKYVLFFFYPADFTFVCPTELHAFQEKLNEFHSRDTEVVACSVDSEFSHWKWLQTPANEGGIKGITYPIVSDQTHAISENFGVLAGGFDYDENGEVTFTGVPQSYRGLFIIDKEGIVRHVTINDMPLGRNVDEALRVIDALQFFEQNGEVCPANWHKGSKGMKATPEGVASFLGENVK